MGVAKKRNKRDATSRHAGPRGGERVPGRLIYTASSSEAVRSENELLIELDEMEFSLVGCMARRMGMTIEELARQIIEQSLDRFQGRVLDPAPDRH